MTIHEAIEQEIGNLKTATRYEYADLEEANATIFDKITSGSFPVCLVFPFDISDNREDGLVSSAEVNALFLTRANQPTIDKPQSEIESELVAPMRALSREFINRLDENEIIDGDGISSVVHRSAHQPVGDAHLYGCWSVFTVNFTEDLGRCLPH